MPRFFIEVEHSPEKIACAQAVKILFNTGSHFLTHAEFGCKDGEHKAWIIVDVDNKESARSILPTEVRSQAKIVQLNKFSMEEIDDILKYHKKN